jgi:uncharacterized membrane protein YgcG
MPLDGVRAWVAEVERKLGKRTRVFLALCVISIGISGAAVYLAIDARNSSVSESDVQELQRELEARIDEGATTPGLGTTPESATPDEGPATAPDSGNSGSGGSGSKSGSSGSSSSNGGADDAEQLEGLLEQARKQAE